MKVEGRSTRQEILRSTVDEIRGKVHQDKKSQKNTVDEISGQIPQIRNRKMYCKRNQREGTPDQKS